MDTVIMIEREQLQNMSPGDFAAMGAQEVAYIKPLDHEGRRVYAVHTADGSQVTLMETYNLAQALIRQNDLEPLAAH